MPVHAGANGASSRVWDHTPPAEMVTDLQKFSPYVSGDVPSTLVERDEAVRADANIEAMAKLPALDKNGTITAGNAPGVNDGAAALVLADADWAKQRGFEGSPRSSIMRRPHGIRRTSRSPPRWPRRSCSIRHGLKAADIAVWEINEAFAAVALTSAARLGLDPEAINMHGGAVALGHPIGASGARIVGAVVHQLRKPRRRSRHCGDLQRRRPG